MGHEFENLEEAELDATPEQVWEAIATGPGIDSWFMGNNVVDGRPGGTVRTVFGGYEPTHDITAWEPGARLAYGSGPDPDGRAIAYEFLIEGRGAGSTVVRLVVSGFLPGDDWEDEYEAMTAGGELFWRTLTTYLTHDAGRTATPITAFGPTVDDWEHAWTQVYRQLGLSRPVAAGDRVRFTPAGLSPVDGVVYSVNSQTLGIRTDEAIYRFLRGFQGPMMACHHVFSAVDAPATERAWRDWLDRVLSAPAT